MSRTRNKSEVTDLIAVHGGACAKYDASLAEDCRFACGTGTVENALTDLERIEKFNCGFGSHLTIDQEVECEASYMSSKNLSFGAVGAISNVFHPSRVARHLAHSNWWKQRRLLHPLILVGRGAEKYAAKNDFPICTPEELISNAAKDSYEKYLHRMLHPYDTHDTVGAISINTNTMEAESGTSSGGIVLKHSGRLGHSCVYGSGTWSERRQYEEPFDQFSERTISICSTGHGESLVKADFCRGIATRVLDDEEGIMYSEIIREFLHEKMEPGARFGGIAMIADKFKERMSLEFLIFHNCRYLPAAVRGRNNQIRVFESKFDPDSCTDDKFVIESFNM
uniref:N-terminal nucleophile aminohydrolase n=1 Tax=Caenorhabditis tropicalis TaxID=1561998 RepID=A0A1I7TM70_9PELO